MNFHILTLFPEMVIGGLGVSITGRAMEKGVITVNAVNIRDYSKDKHRHVDDAPYGGGAGMVMQPGPVVDAYEDLCGRILKRPRVIYMTPQGKVFNQKIAHRCFFPDTIKISRSGAGSSPSGGPWKGGRTCWKGRSFPGRKRNIWRGFGGKVKKVKKCLNVRRMNDGV